MAASSMARSVPAAPAPFRATAPAKLNLALHVTGQRADGYHLLDMLVAFTAEGDELRVTPAAQDRLVVDGPFAPALSGHANSLDAALALARAEAAAAGAPIGPLDILLTKNLPVAAGIGGGSADAAALLSALARHLPPHAASALARRSVELGADVPMCLAGVPSMARGIGEVLSPLPAFPRVPVVLMNPGHPVSTPQVFRHLEDRNQPPLPLPPPQGFSDFAALLGYLRAARNDLQPAASALLPAIADGLAALDRHGAALSRMSGSGATVFGLFVDDGGAEAAAAALARALPGWWVRATHIRPATEEPSA